METIQSKYLAWTSVADVLLKKRVVTAESSVMPGSCVLDIDQKLVGLMYAHSLLRQLRFLQVRLIDGDDIEDDLTDLKKKCEERPVFDAVIGDMITMVEIRLELLKRYRTPSL